MRWTTLISVEELAHAIDHCVVVDCRHDLMKPDWGRQAYADGHIPGAHFLHQDADLASPKGDGSRGRHPLPERDALAARLRGIGLSAGRQLVAYDTSGGMFASRLWWLARWLGHAEVAVLDGGLPAWQQSRYPLTPEVPTPRAGDFAAGASLVTMVAATDLVANLGSRERLVVDARAAERYRGETEPLDPVAGHIPGAANRPTGLNLRPDGRFKPAQALREEFERVLAGRMPATVVNSCGSGVSACHNLLAMEVAGLSGAALYPGSWSEWVADRSRPVATGAEAG